MKLDVFWVNVTIRSQDASISYIKERQGTELATYPEPKTHLGALPGKTGFDIRARSTGAGDVAFDGV